MIADAETNRGGAWNFLKGLEQHLERTVSTSEVQEFLLANKGTNYEFDFVNAFMLPSISSYLQQSLSPADAVTAFLAESVPARKKLGLASGTPASLIDTYLQKYWAYRPSLWWECGGGPGKRSLSPKAAQIGLSASRAHTPSFLNASCFGKAAWAQQNSNSSNRYISVFTTVVNGRFRRATATLNGITIMRVYLRMMRRIAAALSKHGRA